jgi:hypothetical protein
MRKLRKTGAVDQDGNVVTIPRLPSVAASNKPPGWNRWSDAEKVEHLLGMSPKVGVEAARERDRERVLGELLRGFQKREGAARDA